MKIIRLLPWLSLLMAGCQSEIPRESEVLAIVFDRPAGIWEERLPLGNGRLGAMPDGGVEQENIILNEISLWSGSPAEDIRQGTYRILPVVRELLYKERIPRAQELMYRYFTPRIPGSGGSSGAENSFGSYQVLGEAVLHFSYGQSTSQVSDYSRMLDISTATAFTSFSIDGVTYTREYFTSLDNDVLIMYMAASSPGALTFSGTLQRQERARVYTAAGSLFMEGSLHAGQNGIRGMRFYTRMDVIPCRDGEVSVGDGSITLTGGTEACVILSAATDFDVSAMSLRQDSTFRVRADSLSEHATGESFPDLKKKHVDAYQQLFHRVRVELPDSSDLYFQLGRYLLISSTRPGSLPPNMQGLWTPSVQTPWNGAYDLNMQLQMTFWPALTTNLAELHLPLLDFTGWLSEKGIRTAREYYGAPGWIVHAHTNIWGFTAPGENTAWSAQYTGSAWLCSRLWKHYTYTLDVGPLKKTYPVMKEAALFFLNMLMEDPQYGWWVPAPSMSYGNTYYIMDETAPDKLSVPLFLCMGSTADVQSIRELFSNVIAANRVLMNTSDFPLIYKLEEALDRLPPYSVNATGCLQKWLYDYPEEDLRLRNVSHLYGLYPGNSITEDHPLLMDACRKTLERRGFGGSGWQMAWNLNLRARLGDGNGAYRVLGEMMSPALQESISPYLTRDISSITLLGSGLYPNGFSSNPPFRIDGNMGVCAGIAEMLLQSHRGFIHLLPALPEAWSGKGSFSGLCAEGGAVVSCRWEDGQVRELSIEAAADNTFVLKVPDSFHRIKEDFIRLPLKKGDLITLHTRSNITHKKNVRIFK